MNASTSPLNKTTVLALEGGDGVGKSTLLKGLQERLEALNYKVFMCHLIKSNEPGAYFYNTWVNNLVSDVTQGAVGMLYSNLTTMRTTVHEAKESGKYDFIIVDRSLASTLVYQTEMMNNHWLLPAVQNALKEPANCPDLTVYLYANPQEAIERIKKNRAQLDWIETKGPAYQAQIQAAYERVFLKYRVLSPLVSLNTSMLDAEQTTDSALETVLVTHHRRINEQLGILTSTEQPALV